MQNVSLTQQDAPRTRRDVCPICDSTRYASTLAVERQNKSFALATCGGCGFVFVTDPEGDTASHADHGALVWRFRRRHHQVRQLLLKHLKPGARISEIGCGRGELGFLLRNDPFKYVGYEPARGLSDFGISHGVNIVAGLFDETHQGESDAVVLDNVIEHVLDPVGLLRTACEGLKPGGMLVVIVPNRSDVRALSPSWRSRNLWIPPDHINYFAASDLRRIFSKLGLRMRPFGFEALGKDDWRYAPRALLESVGISLLGHNVYAVKGA